VAVPRYAPTSSTPILRQFYACHLHPAGRILPPMKGRRIELNQQAKTNSPSFGCCPSRNRQSAFNVLWSNCTLICRDLILLTTIALCVIGCSSYSQRTWPFYNEGEAISVAGVVGEWSRHDGHNPPYPRRWRFVESVSTHYLLLISDTRFLPPAYLVVFFKRDDKLLADFEAGQHSLWSVEVKETCLTLKPWCGRQNEFPAIGSPTNGFSSDGSVILTNRTLIPRVNFRSSAEPAPDVSVMR